MVTIEILFTEPHAIANLKLLIYRVKFACKDTFSGFWLSGLSTGAYIESCRRPQTRPNSMRTLLPSAIRPPVLLLVAALAAIVLADNYAVLQRLDQHLYQIAGGAGPATGQGLTLPLWGGAAGSLFWCVTLAVWLWLLPRISPLAAVLTAFIVLCGLAALQLLAQKQYGLWLPQGLLIQFLAVSTPIVLLWSHQSKRWRRLIEQRDAALLELAEIRLQSGQLEQVSQHLQQCEPGHQVCELGYQLAVQQEQRRSFSAAKKTYQWLAGIDPGFKDVAEKTSGSLITTVANGENYLATQTLNISDDQLRQPRLGRYRIEAELGRGAMGTVYLGVDPKIARRVAIKTLNYKMFGPSELDEVKQRFFREAEAAGRLSHPNIVTVFDVGEEPDLCFIAMDYVEGDSLRAYTTQENLLEVSTVYRLIMQVAEALDYAHQQNIVHRDIKPGNLLYDATQEQIKVADFGIARIIDNSSTKTGDILGSPLYMSPEQLKGQKVTGATDIYSLGVTLYQLLTGESPYFGDSIANLAYQVLNKKYKSVREVRPNLPASAPRIINKAMAKEPDKRFPDAFAMADALRKALKKDFGID